MTLWTEEEISAYRQVQNRALDHAYRMAGLAPENPEGRAEYLAENSLGLGMTDHDAVMRIAAQEGKPAALNFLERMFIASVREE